MAESSEQAKAELLKRWVEALRSGKYGQARNRLKRGEDYCCLGVLCEVSGLGAWVHLEDGEAFRLHDGSDINAGSLPHAVWLAVGLSDARGEEGNYIGMNDSGSGFAAIAAEIEKAHPDVFGVPAHA